QPGRDRGEQVRGGADHDRGPAGEQAHDGGGDRVRRPVQDPGGAVARVGERGDRAVGGVVVRPIRALGAPGEVVAVGGDKLAGPAGERAVELDVAGAAGLALGGGEVVEDQDPGPAAAHRSTTRDAGAARSPRCSGPPTSSSTAPSSHSTRSSAPATCSTSPCTWAGPRPASPWSRSGRHATGQPSAPEATQRGASSSAP